MVATVKKLTGRQYLRIGQSFYDVGNLKLLVLGRVDVEMVATKLFIEIGYLCGCWLTLSWISEVGQRTTGLCLIQNCM